MPKKKYESINFQGRSLDIINKANQIIAEYAAQGYSLTLRQIYYQCVARDWLPETWADSKTGSVNNQKSYDKLGVILSNGRLAGLIDWNAIEDRTREVGGNSHWDSPADIISAAASSFRLDKWTTQEHRVEIWVEKDALEGVVSKAAKELDIQYFSCRGYASQTSMWDAGQRLKRYAIGGQVPVILHLGDLDPSGVDMSRDIEFRLRQFMDNRGNTLQFKRIALNPDQIETYNPPPNPAKTTDCRFASFKEQYGEDSWELDALSPSVVDTLITDSVANYRDNDAYAEREAEETEHRKALRHAANRWPEVAEWLLDSSNGEE